MRRERLCLYALIVLAWGLRLFHLGRPELWFDEAASYFIASKSWAGIVTYVAHAPFEHPPFYYLLLHASMALFGHSEWALRFPSVLLGLILVVGLWRVTARRFGRTLAAVTLPVAAISPFLVTYSQEARMYALLQCLGLAATVLFVAALRCNRARLWLAYGATMLVGLTTHYFFAFLFPAHVLMGLVIAEKRGKLLRVSLAVGAAGALALASWLALAPGLQGTVERMWREALWGKPPSYLYGVLSDWALGGAIVGDGRPAWAAIPVLAVASLTAIGFRSTSLGRRWRWMLLAWVAVPTGLAVIVPYGGLVLRHFSYIAPALTLLTAAGLLLLWRWHRAAALLGATAILAAAVCGLAWQYGVNKGQYGRALEEVRQQERSGDFLLLANPDQWVLAAYYNHTNLPQASVGHGQPLPVTDLVKAQRVWVVGWETWAASDLAGLSADLVRLLYPSRQQTYSRDQWLWLLYAAPPKSTTAGPLAWEGGRQMRSLRVSEGSLLPGDAATVEITWQPNPDLAHRTAVALRLVDEHGGVWAEDVQQPLLIDEGGLLRSRQALSLPAGTPPGRYNLQVGLIDLRSNSSLAASDGNGSALGPWPQLLTVEVSRGPVPDAWPAGQPLSPGLAYVGSEATSADLIAGERWRGILRFRGLSQPSDVQLRFSLISGGRHWQLGELPLAAGELQSSQWLPGEVWRCAYEVALPPDLPTGHYVLAAQAYHDGALLRPPGTLPFLDPGYLAVSQLNVQARPKHRLEEKPSHPVDALFGQQVRLLGYDLQLQGSQALLKLYWQCVAPTAEPYKAFVHLDAAGQGVPLSQADAPPSSLATSDWLPSEEYLSEHRLSLAGIEPGQPYSIVVGLYSERTMARLPATGADAGPDSVAIPLPERSP